METARCEERALSSSRTHTRSAPPGAASPLARRLQRRRRRCWLDARGRRRRRCGSGNTRLCLSSRPGAQGRDPQRGSPESTGAGEGKHWGVKVQGLPAAKVTGPGRPADTAGVWGECAGRVEKRGRLPGHRPWTAARGHAPPPAHAARSREAGGRHGLQDTAPETARSARRRGAASGARRGSRATVSPQPAAPSTRRRASRASGANSAYRRPGEPLLPRMPPPSVLCPAPISAEIRAGYPPRCATPQDPGAVGSEEEGASGAPRAERGALLSARRPDTDLSTGGVPAQQGPTLAPSTWQGVRRIQALGEGEMHWLSMFQTEWIYDYFLKTLLKKKIPTAVLPPACGEPPWQLSKGEVRGTRGDVTAPRATLSARSRRARERARPLHRGGAAPRRGGHHSTHLGHFRLPTGEGRDGWHHKKRKGRDQTKIVKEMKMLSDLSLKHSKTVIQIYIFLKFSLC